MLADALEALGAMARVAVTKIGGPVRERNGRPMNPRVARSRFME
jgi:hypothetical protein